MGEGFSYFSYFYVYIIDNFLYLSIKMEVFLMYKSLRDKLEFFGKEGIEQFNVVFF